MDNPIIAAFSMLAVRCRNTITNCSISLHFIPRFYRAKVG